MTTKAIAQLEGKLKDKEFELNLQFMGGPLALSFRLKDSISLKAVYDWGSDQLHDLIGVGLPDLTNGPWGKVLNIKGVEMIPGVYLAPGSETSAFYIEMAFTKPIRIGGTAEYAGIEITLEPNLEIHALYLIYNKQAGGLEFKAKVKIPSQTGDKYSLFHETSNAADTTQIVSYPFPLPPQKSSKVFELHYIGLGQRIGPNPVGSDVPDPINAIFDELETQFATNDPKEIITTLATNFYHPDRNWFIAAHLGLKGWDLKFIFNDPAMYGIRIAAPMEPQTFFSGFLFEILYQKLGPGLGVYYGVLTLPMALRRIPINGVVLILPGFSIWIYTNGDFRVNIGWPLGDISIGIQLGPLTGKGGFYFARLRSSDNPGYKPGEDADYNPILEFGIGLGVYAQVGVSAGIFSATLSASLSTTLQGLLAWLADGGGGTNNPVTKLPDHYWFAGNADIVVLLQGSIDFAVVKASVSISLSASAAVALETGCRTIITVSAQVSAKASIKVLFVRIHFSFSAHITHSFEFGSGSLVASVNGPVNMGRVTYDELPILRSARRSVQKIIHEQIKSQRRFVLREDALLYGANVDPLYFNPLTAEPIDLYFVLQPTARYDISPARFELIASLFIDAPAPDSGEAGSPSHRTGFENLVRSYLGWLVDTASTPGKKWSDRFEEVISALGQGAEDPSGPFRDRTGFGMALCRFIQTQLNFKINTIDHQCIETLSTAAVLPMFPEMALSWKEGSQVKTIYFNQFDDYGIPDEHYPNAVTIYYEELALLGSSQTPRKPYSVEFETPAQNNMARYVFNDYFLMLGRQTAQDLHQAALRYEENNDVKFQDLIMGLDAQSHDDLSTLMDIVMDHALDLTGETEYEYLLDHYNYSGASGLTSRFMLYGMKLPAPDHIPPDPRPENMKDVPTHGIYQLTGQQIQVPDGEDSFTTALSLNPFTPVPLDWITFDGGASSKTTISLPAEVPPSPNPQWNDGWKGCAYDPGNVHVDMMQPITPHQQAFALKNQNIWQDVEDTHSIFPLPEPALQEARKQDIKLKLSATPPWDPETNFGESEDTPAGSSGLLIKLSITRTPDYSSINVTSSDCGSPSGGSPGNTRPVQFLPFIYEAGPADEHTRDLIRQALQGDLSQANIKLLYTDPDTNEQVSDELADNSMIFKSDFSTESKADDVQVHFTRTLQLFKSNAEKPVVSATLDNVQNFLWLLWECSVVNGGGYYFFYNTEKGEGLPEELFRFSNSISLDILLNFNNGTLFSGSPASAVIPVPDAANVMITNLWNSDDALYAQLLDSKNDAVVQYQPTWPAGTVGFSLDWKHRPFDSPEPEIPVETLYQLFQFSVQENDDFNHSVWSMPTGPNDRDMKDYPPGLNEEEVPWLYQHVVPLLPFIKGPSPDIPNRYSVIGKTVEIAFRMCDIYGLNLPETEPYHFIPEYNDPLIALTEWPGINVAWQIVLESDDAASMRIELFFDPASIVPEKTSPDEMGSPSGFDPEADHELWVAAQQKYQLISDQLDDPVINVAAYCSLGGQDPLTDDTASLMILQDFVREVLQEIGIALEGMQPVSISGQLSYSIPFMDVMKIDEDIIKVNTRFEISRDAGASPNPAVDLLPAIASVTSVLSPNYQLNENPHDRLMPEEPKLTTLTEFAKSMESAFNDFDGHGGTLKVAQSKSESGQADERFSGLWVVRWSEVRGISADFQHEQIYFAIQPLSSKLINGTVQGHRYTNVDLDVWAIDFLSILDTLRSPSVAAGLSLYDTVHATNHYQTIIEAIEELSEKIPKGLVPVFTEQEGLGDPKLAREQLKQVLLNSLSSAYTISTIAQASANVSTVQSSSPVTTAPRFFGTIVNPNESSPGVDTGSPSSNQKPYSFSNPKLLINQGNQILNYFVAVAEPEAQTELSLPIEYHINYLQHDFNLPEAHEGFVPSTWLKFVIADDPLFKMPITLPNEHAQIPIPLRIDPLAPSLLQQKTSAYPLGKPGSPRSISQEIEDALRWEYLTRIGHEWAHQDELYFKVTYNKPLRSDRAFGANELSVPQEALFEALGEFRQIWPGIPAWVSDLVKFSMTGEVTTGSPSDLEEALKQFESMTGAIISAWPDYDTEISDAVKSSCDISIHKYFISMDRENPKAVDLHGRVECGMPLIWPDVTDKQGEQGTEGPENIPASPAFPPESPDSRWHFRKYIFNHIPDLSELSFNFKPISILEAQSVDTSAYVIRSRHLVPGFRTNPLFVFQTEAVQFPEPIVPLIQREALEPLFPERSLVESLYDIIEPFMSIERILDTILRIEGSYSFLLVADDENGLRSESKILLADHIDPEGSNGRVLVEQLGREFAGWYNRNEPSATGGRIDLSIFVFAKIDGNENPVVLFNRIPLMIKDDPTWWSSTSP